MNHRFFILLIIINFSSTCLYAQKISFNNHWQFIGIEFATKEIELSEGQILYIPYGQSFKAHSRSNYLIFSEDEINAREILTFLNEEIIGIKNFEDHFFEAFNPESVLQSMVPLTPIESKQKASSFLTKVKMMKFKYSSKST